MYIFPNPAMQFLGAPPLPRRRARPNLTPNLTRPSISRRRMQFLGQAETIAQIQAQYFPTVDGTAGFTQQDLLDWQTAVQALQLPQYYKVTPGDCGTAAAPSSVSLPAVITTGIGAGLLKAGAATGPAAPFVIAAGAALTVLGDVFGIFSGAHAAAVAKEETELCATVPAVNSALQAVQLGLQQGVLTSAQANQALASIMQAYQTNTSNIIKMSSGACNAACVYYRMLEGIVAEMQAQIAANPPAADLGPAAGAAAGVTSTVANAAAATGLPTWAIYALGGLVLLNLID